MAEDCKRFSVKKQPVHHFGVRVFFCGVGGFLRREVFLLYC
jgi:hypothetical protein